MLVDSWLPQAAAVAPQSLAVNNLTYAQLLEQASRAARQLAALGVVEADRVALLLPPGELFAINFHAVLLLGAVAVPIDPSAAAEQIALRTSDVRVVIDGPLESHEDPAATLQTTHNLSAPAVVIYSSGSSGAAKEVVLSYGNFWWSAAGSAVAIGRDADERWLTPLPLSHVGGLSVLVRSAIYRSQAVIHERFELDSVLSTLQAGDGPTLVSLVPTTLQRLLDAGLREPPSLRWVLLGGGPISDNLLQQAAEASVPVAPSYGMTEACSQIMTRGAPLFCTRIGLGESDEILVSGPTVAGQCQPQLRSGDIGRRGESGQLEIVGRLSDLIISGGENVAPETVEAALAQHPSVADVAVVGREDAQWGQSVTAIVVLEPESSVTADELIEFSRPRLSPHERPKQVEFRSTLGRSAAGKLNRRGL